MTMRTLGVVALFAAVVVTLAVAAPPSSSAAPVVGNCCFCYFVGGPNPHWACSCDGAAGGEWCTVRPTSCTLEGFCP